VSGIVAVCERWAEARAGRASGMVGAAGVAGTATSASVAGVPTVTSRPAGTLTSSSNSITRFVPSKRGAEAPVARTGALVSCATRNPPATVLYSFGMGATVSLTATRSQ